MDIKDINSNLCTHINYAYAKISNVYDLKPLDEHQDIEQGGYANFYELKTRNKDLKIILSIGSENGSDKFSTLVADSEHKQKFVQNTIKFLRQHRFDGVDFMWKHPTIGM